MKSRRSKSRDQNKAGEADKANAPKGASSAPPEGNGAHVDAPPPGEVVLYRSPDGHVQVDVRLEQGTVWLTQRQIADLLGASVPNVSFHLKNIFEEQELDEAATIKEYLIVQSEGGRNVSRAIAHYNLDAIIAVGYRVNSRRGTQFRIWATRTLREHLLRGYTLNEKRLRERGLSEVQHALAMLTRTVRRDPADPQSRALLDVCHLSA